MSGIFSVSPAHEAGWAVIRVSGEARLASRASMALRVAEMSNRLFAPSQVSANGGDLTMLVGPEVTDYLEAQTPYTLMLPDAGLSGSVVWPVIQPPRADSRRVIDLPGLKASPPDAPVTGHEHQTTAGTAGVGSTYPVAPIDDLTWRPRRAALGAVALLAVVALAGLGWRVLLRAPGVVTPGMVQPGLATTGVVPPVAPAVPLAASPPAVPPAAEPPVAAGNQATLSGAGSQVAGLATLSVPEVIAQAQSPAAIDQEAERRLEAGHPDDGLLLLEAAASRGSAGAMARLAGLYDPDGFDAKGPIPSPDIRESARYYRDAAKAGDGDVDAPRAKLHDTLKAAADKGDKSAELALRDFWP